MKNLKKALSLVLASAMLIGMMVVGTGAAHADVTAEHNEEAIGLVSAAGIMGANEEFNPDAYITRNEMAVVMVNMLGLDTKAFAGASQFTDVPAWAADFVDACYANKIVSGVSATEYNGGANVTTAEAALMMLKALGYYDKAKLNDWLLDTVKTASKIELLEGIDAKATAYLTRNEVAQLAFNALNTEWVEEIATGSNTSIKGEDLEITIDSTVLVDPQEELLLNKLFDDRFVPATGAEATDEFGLPAKVWLDTDADEDEQRVVVVTEEADKVVISDAAYEAGETEAYTDLVNEKFEKTATLNKAANAGDVIYFYAEKDEDGKKTGNYDGYVVNYELAQVTEIDEEVSIADEKDGVKAYITLDIAANDIKDIDFAGFDYEEDDYILVVLNADEDEVLASELVKTVEGKVTAINKKGEVKIAGSYYAVADAEIEAEIDTNATWYLNKADQIIMAGDATVEKSEDYAVIYNVVDVTDEIEANEDGYFVDEGDKVYDVYVILADGSKAKYSYSFDASEDTTDEMAALAASEEDIFVVTAYSVEDGEFAFETAKYTISDPVAADFDANKYVVIGTAKKYADSKTEFIFAEKDDNKMVVKTSTGLKNVDYAGNVVVVYEKTAIKYVFASEIVEETADAEYAILGSTDIASEKVEKKIVYSIELADGSVIKTKVAAVAEMFAAMNVGDFFSYTLTDGFVAATTDVVVGETAVNVVDTFANVDMIGEGYYVIAGDEYVVAADAEIKNVLVTMKENEETEAEDDYVIDTIKVSDGELKKDVKVYIAETKTEDDEVIIKTAFIVKVRK